MGGKNFVQGATFTAAARGGATERTSNGGASYGGISDGRPPAPTPISSEEERHARRNEKGWGREEFYVFHKSGSPELPEYSMTTKQYDDDQNNRLFNREGKREAPHSFVLEGSYKHYVYSKEQQEKLGVDEDGVPKEESKIGVGETPNKDLFERRKNWTDEQKAYFNEYGSAELPNCEGSSTMLGYSKEQQLRLKVDLFGNVTGTNEAPKGKDGSNHFYFNLEQQKKLGVDEDGCPVERSEVKNPSNAESTQEELNFSATSELIGMCQAKYSMHQLSYAHLSCRQYWLFTIPIAVISMISGIVSFLASSDLFRTGINSILSAFVGSLAVVGVFVQTLNGICNYGERAAMHNSAVMDMRDLCDDLELIQIGTGTGLRVRESTDANEKTSLVGEEGKRVDTVASIRSRYKQCMQGCKSEIPLAITDAFRVIDSEMAMTWTRNAKNLFRGDIGFESAGTVLMSAAYNELVVEITKSKFWPMFIGDTTNTVKTVMTKIREDRETGEVFWTRSRESGTGTAARQIHDNDLWCGLKKDVLIGFLIGFALLAVPGLIVILLNHVHVSWK